MPEIRDLGPPVAVGIEERVDGQSLLDVGTSTWLSEEIDLEHLRAADLRPRGPTPWGNAGCTMCI